MTENFANNIIDQSGQQIYLEDKRIVDSVLRGYRLTDFDLSVLKQAVADGNLEKYGLKVGDQKTIISC